MRAPLAAVAAVFAAGVCFFWGCRPPIACLWISTAALFFMVVQKRALQPFLLLALCAVFGTLRGEIDSRPPPDSIVRSLSSEEHPIICEGRVEEVFWRKPLFGPARRGGWLTIKREKVYLRLPAVGPQLSVGDRVRLHGSIRSARPVSSDGFDEEGWLWVRHAVGVLSVQDPEGVELLGIEPGWGIALKRRVESFRRFLQEQGRSTLDRKEAAYLEALLLGQGEWIPKSEWDLFRKTGTVHILVVSGLHVGLISLIFLSVLSVCRVPRVPRFLLVSLGLIFYCVAAGSRPSVVRSTVGGVTLALGSALGAGNSALNGLGLAALWILWDDPRALADPSFQLSFAAVIGLLTLTPGIERFFEAKEIGNGRGRLRFPWIVRPAAASFGAWAATAPIIGWHFHIVTPAALLANPVVVPWSMLLIADGFLVYGLSLFSLVAAGPFAAVFGVLLEGLLRLNDFAARLPYASLNL